MLIRQKPDAPASLGVLPERTQQAEKEVPIQVMVPSNIRKQVALMGVENGESIRTVVLRGLKAIGVEVPDNQLVDRRGRRRA
jgi:hypothetical protein